jgi:preprotein translocase subunit SecE
MNREMRRFSEKEERRQKPEKKRPQRRGPGGKPIEAKPIYKRAWSFLKEVRVELERVSWPTREQMIAFTAVTLITTTVLTLLIFAIDLGLREGIFALLRVGS